MASYGILRTRSALQAERKAAVEADMQAARAQAAEMALRAGAANRRAYLYFAYLTGLALLVLWAGGITLS